MINLNSREVTKTESTQKKMGGKRTKALQLEEGENLESSHFRLSKGKLMLVGLILETDLHE